MSNPEKFNSAETPFSEKFGWNFNVQFETVASQNHPNRNEDAVLAESSLGIFGVFDGLGGYAGGELASRMASEYIAKVSKERLAKKLSLNQTRDELKKVFFEINKELIDFSLKNPGFEEMGTTASVVKIWESRQGKKKAIIINIGDSRIYLYSVARNLRQITLDDNLVSYFLKDEMLARIVQKKLNNVVDLQDLDSEERFFFKNRNIITQHLGVYKINPRIHTINVRRNDRIIITSDGIHDNLTDKEIEEILRSFENNQEAVRNLVNAASQISQNKENPRAKFDDMTAVVFRIP